MLYISAPVIPYKSPNRWYSSWVAVHLMFWSKLLKMQACSSINNNHTEDENALQWQTEIESLGQLETKRVGTNLFSVTPNLNHVHGCITDSFSCLISWLID